MKSKSQGFTMLEVITVIAILALIAGIAYPAYTSAFQHAQKKTNRMQLDSLNAAIALFKLESGSKTAVLLGHHDEVHHRKLLEALSSEKADFAKMDPSTLVSEGEGERFCFTGYQGETAPPSNLKNPTSWHGYENFNSETQFSWTDENEFRNSNLNPKFLGINPKISPQELEEVANILVHKHGEKHDER